jgi:hypothetical protein
MRFAPDFEKSCPTELRIPLVVGDEVTSPRRDSAIPGRLYENDADLLLFGASAAKRAGKYRGRPACSPLVNQGGRTFPNPATPIRREGTQVIRPPKPLVINDVPSCRKVGTSRSWDFLYPVRAAPSRTNFPSLGVSPMPTGIDTFPEAELEPLRTLRFSSSSTTSRRQSRIERRTRER